jgi:hypothetical protein
VTIIGKLVDINSNSGLGGNLNGLWSMTLQLRSSNGATMTVSNTYRFRAGFAATAACDNVAQAFLPAVQDLVGKELASQDFISLIR